MFFFTWVNTECKRKLMAHPKGKDIDVKTCLEILRQHEAVDVTIKRMGDNCQVSTTYSRDPTKYSQKNAVKIKHRQAPQKPRNQSTQRNAQQKLCRWCGGEPHSRDTCPAKHATCNFCKKKSHFEKACKLKAKAYDKPMRQKILSDSEDDTTYQETISISLIMIKTNHVKSWQV